MSCPKMDFFELPAPLTFRHVFQSCAYWVGVNSGFVPQVVRPLRQNHRKHSYLLNLNERQLVLSATVQQMPFFDQHQQSINPVIEHVGRAGIGPALIYGSFDKGFVVTEYLEGRCWTAADFQQLENIERLVELLKQLHDLPKIGPVFSVTKAESFYWAAIKHEYDVIPNRLQTLQKRMGKVIDYLQERRGAGVVCHNNLLDSHVLETEHGLRLVGWESAAINDPYYDLAVVASNHQFSVDQLDHLVRCYAGNKNVDEYEYFYNNYAMYLYLETLRCWIEVGKHREAGQEQEIEAKFDALTTVLHRLGV